MAVNNLHRTKSAEDLPDFLSGLTTREVSINGIESTTVDPLCSNYPFGDQDLYTGTIEYDEKPEFGRGRELQFDFEARSQSGLLIVKSDVDVSFDNILGQVNSATSPQFRIYRRLSPHRTALWDFVEGSESVIEITLINEYGEEVGIEEIEVDRESIIGEYPIEDATFSYSYNGHNILVRYTAGSLQIDVEDPAAIEYIIQLFERDVIHEESQEKNSL